MSNLSDDELLAELGVRAVATKAAGRTPRQERIIAGFEEILRFTGANGRLPQHGEGRDIFERLYAVRLNRLRTLPEARELLAGLETVEVLDPSSSSIVTESERLDDDELLTELLEGGEAAESDITVLRHVSSRDDRRAAEEIANRTPCNDFDRFKSLFEQAEKDLKLGVRQALPFGKDASVAEGNFFILGGQFVYVAELGDIFRTASGDSDARLRVIYSNETESNLLLRSLQRALYKDSAGRRLTDPDAGPLFSERWEEDDIACGTIYVLRSQSNHPFISQHRELIHKIGVTGGEVEVRIANAALDPTYLLADVDVVATYKLANVQRTKLENLLHRVFAPAQLDLTIQDRFGHPVRPREWFLVPLHMIDEAVHRVRDGSISEMIYDPKAAKLVKH